MNTRDAVTNGTSSFSWAPQSGALTLRDWLAHLARTDRLATVDKPVALEHELAAIAKRLDGEQAAFFTRPVGHDIPVVSGFMSKRAWIAEAMGARV
jgi:2,5-furandicarboxylate decarboxylase 1